MEDEISELLDDQNFNNYFIDIGGEILIKGKKEKNPWIICIENPDINNSKPIECLSKKENEKSFSIPWFLILFFIFCISNNLFSIPDKIISLINNLSNLCILLAISAIGVKTNFSLFANISYKYFTLIVLETFFLLFISIRIKRSVYY